MGVRSKRLAATTLSSTAATTIYTAPSGETALVKRVCTQNNSGAALSVTYFIGVSGTNYGFLVESFTAADSRNKDTWLCLQPGETIGAVASVANVARISLHGSELEGVAD